MAGHEPDSQNEFMSPYLVEELAVTPAHTGPPPSPWYAQESPFLSGEPARQAPPPEQESGQTNDAYTPSFEATELETPLFELEMGIFGDDDRAQVRDATVVPFRWVCQISVQKRNADGKIIHNGPAGTGVLISPRHVLTAAHVLYNSKQDERGQWVDDRAAWVTVAPGRNGSAQPFGSYSTTAWVTHPRYNPRARDSWRWDYGLITLREAVGDKTFAALGRAKLCYWGSAQCGGQTLLQRVAPRLLEGAQMWTAGYPGDKGGVTLWCAPGRIQGVDLPNRRRIMNVSADALQGQSGSPVWIANQGSRTLVGILTRRGESANTAIRVTLELLRQLQTWMAGRQHELSAEEELFAAEPSDEGPWEQYAGVSLEADTVEAQETWQEPEFDASPQDEGWDDQLASEEQFDDVGELEAALDGAEQWIDAETGADADAPELEAGYAYDSAAEAKPEAWSPAADAPDLEAESFDLARAVELNRGYGKRLGWQNRYDDIARVLGFTNMTPGPELFAEAVFAWQRRQGLSADGIVGPNTWRALQRSLAAATPSSPAPSPVAPSIPALGGLRKPAGYREVIRRGKPRGLARYADQRLDAKLLALRAAGSLSVTDDAIDTFQRIAEVETGGKIQGLNTWDSAVVSSGFMQWTLQHDKLQEWIRRTPTAYRRFGIELDPDRTYSWTYPGNKVVRQPAIAGAANKDDLRWGGWAERFYLAGLDDEIIVAEVQLAQEWLERQLRGLHANLRRRSMEASYALFRRHYDQSLYLRGMFQAGYNNLPAATINGAVSALRTAAAQGGVSTDRFVQIFAAAVLDAYRARNDDGSRIVSATRNGARIP